MIRFAVIALALLACSDEPSNNSETCSIPAEGNSILFNFTSDYATGELRWMSLDSATYSPGALSFGQDTQIEAIADDLFIMSRYPGILSCVKAKNICNEKAIKQVKLDDDNPYEIVIIGNKGYMVLWDTHYIQEFDPSPSRCAPTGKIPLPELPPLQKGNSSIDSRNPASIKASGDTLLITMQRLEWDSLGMAPNTPNGLLVRINATTKTTIDTISLKLWNPFSSTVLSKGKLYIPQNGLWDPGMNLLDLEQAGLEVVDLATGSTEVLIKGSELGGAVQGIALDEKEQILYMLVYKEWRDAPIIPFDLTAKKALDPLPNVIDGFGGLVFDEVARKLFIGERDLSEFGLKVYDPATKTTTPICDDMKYPLPPYSQTIARW